MSEAVEGDSTGGMPAVEIFDHCDSGGEIADWLKGVADRAVKEALRSKGGRGELLLPELELIEVSLVSDEAIARVHGEFMDDPTPTDVITFQHGEILISLETAARNAADLGHPMEREALLYLVHGMLHLNGFDDQTGETRAEMDAVQSQILDAICPFTEGENPG